MNKQKEIVKTVKNMNSKPNKPTSSNELLTYWPPPPANTSHPKNHNFTKLLKTANLETKPHQIDGVNWILSKETNVPYTEPYMKNTKCGGIIADEMGLGKTIQIIAPIVCNYKPKTLIVLPLVLLDQWKQTIETTTNMYPQIYHPSYKSHYNNANNYVSIKKDNKDDKDDPKDDAIDAAITITTYGMLSKSKSMLLSIKWDRIIFDEAHHLRNTNTRAYICASKLNCNILWLVTGTPIQNKLQDMYSLLSLFGHCNHTLNNKPIFNEIIKHTLLKRTKKSTNIVLPKILEKHIFIDWENNKEMEAALAAHNIAYATRPENAMYSRECRLVALLRAKQSCINPTLLPGNEAHDEDEIGIKIKHVYKTFVENSFAKPKLVFCHYRDEINSIHKILQPHIKNENLQVYIYDGRTTTEERNKILNASNQNAIIDVLLIQIQCGCEGLNLQYFKEIYFTSPHWNPAMEDQAIARCHRIGQTSDIQIFKFFMNPFNTQNTQPEDLSMDLRILEIQKNKKLHHI